MSKARLLAAVLLAVAISGGALSVAAQTPTPTTLPLSPTPAYVAAMVGCQEIPPVSTSAQGIAVFQPSPDGSTLNYAVWVFDITNVDEAHIHIAPRGQAGPIGVWLYPSPATQQPKVITGRFDGLLAQGTITSANLVGPLAGMTVSNLIQQLQSGNAYANVHTVQNPAGEIAGPIIATTPTAATPTAGATVAAGAAPTAAASPTPAGGAGPGY